MIDFGGRVAIVTGAGNGMGRSYALELARRGASVVVNDVGCQVDGTGSSSSAADAVVEEIRSVGGTAIASYASVATPEEGEEIVASAVDTFGRVDSVILNAGILLNVPFHEMSADQLNRVISTNLLGAIHVAQPAYKRMREQRSGRFVFISSSAGLFGSRNGANYASSKAAMIGLSSTIGIEGAEFGIMSNIVTPGARTRMADAIRPEDLGTDILKRMEAAPSSPSAGMEPSFVTPIVVYLASEACAVNQQIYSAARGRFARAFVGVSTGWYASTKRLVSAEEIAMHLSEIDDLAAYHLPRSAFDEMEIVELARVNADPPVTR